MYTFAHPIEDALENITHSLCTLEFEDQRPFYNWLLERLHEAGFFAQPLPQQYEFSRLNLNYAVLSKRKLMQLVEERHVDGWDDPRLPTLAGARRRGFTPEAFRAFAERIGVSKSESWIDMGVLEDCVRNHLNEVAPRRIGVLDPVKLIIDNYPEGQTEKCVAPNHPQKPELGTRELLFARELWIEREDFMATPSKGYFRLYPGNRVRLRYGYVVECTGFDQDDIGQSHRRALQLLPRLALRFSGRGPVQGEGQCALGGRAGRLSSAKCDSTTACSACRTRARAIATSCWTSIRNQST